MIQTWNIKLQKRAAEYWQMVRNENTAKTYDTWKNNSPVIIPRKLQMKQINGEPLTQTQLRESQVMFNFQSEIELMKLRAESHEERYKKIDKEMEDLLEKKLSGQRMEVTKKLWKEECVKEEIRSRERWENSNVKWTEKYEAEFLKFFASQNPFIYDENFLPPKIRNKPVSQQQQQNTGNNERPDNNSETDNDVIITGVTTYAQAAKVSRNTQSNKQGTTFIEKRVKFDKTGSKQTQSNFSKQPPTFQNNRNPRPPLLNNPPIQSTNRPPVPEGRKQLINRPNTNYTNKYMPHDKYY